ncbi:hypothetical protein ACFOEE_05785 [Pseudoalteromonas fenneropenaei]|uniref:Uncharacterized protein n=1 Tax=Pseudoalteromonas fenneropenaei TaxID=1737459 RepID=A0ABV7CHE9_9GAMM
MSNEKLNFDSEVKKLKSAFVNLDDVAPSKMVWERIELSVTCKRKLNKDKEKSSILVWFLPALTSFLFFFFIVLNVGDYYFEYEENNLVSEVERLEKALSDSGFEYKFYYLYAEVALLDMKISTNDGAEDKVEFLKKKVGLLQKIVEINNAEVFKI